MRMSCGTYRIPAVIAVCLAICAVFAARPATAHHSFAMYDRGKLITIEGVVKEFQWANPHVWIEVLVPNAKGAQDEWSVECTSVNFMTRHGFTRHTLKPGDKISITLTPLKDGSLGGSFKSVKSLNGAPLALESED